MRDKMRRMFMSKEEVAEEMRVAANELLATTEASLQHQLMVNDRLCANARTSLQAAIARGDRSEMKAMTNEQEKLMARKKMINGKLTNLHRSGDTLQDSEHNTSYVQAKMAVIEADRYSMEASGLSETDIIRVVDDSEEVDERTASISEILGTCDLDSYVAQVSDDDEDWEARILNASGLTAYNTQHVHVPERLHASVNMPDAPRAVPQTFKIDPNLDRV